LAQHMGGEVNGVHLLEVAVLLIAATQRGTHRLDDDDVGHFPHSRITSKLRSTIAASLPQTLRRQSRAAMRRAHPFAAQRRYALASTTTSLLGAPACAVCRVTVTDSLNSSAASDGGLSYGESTSTSPGRLCCAISPG